MTMTEDPTTAPAAAQTSDPDREIPTRRMKFEPTLADVPKHFSQDGDLIGSHLVAMLSAVFPDGEDFFVRSVRHYRKDITDPVLKEQVKGFIGQEAIHGREHRDLNDRLDELGYPTKRIERLTKWGLELRSKYAPAKANLAATAALEHFTATLAETIRRRMVGVFPQLGDVRVDHAWGGFVDVTRNRAPDFGARCPFGRLDGGWGGGFGLLNTVHGLILV